MAAILLAWEQVRPVSMEYGLVINDVVKFCKTFCLVLCYGVSIDRYYKNRRKVSAFLYLRQTISVSDMLLYANDIIRFINF